MLEKDLLPLALKLVILLAEYSDIMSILFKKRVEVSKK